MVVHQRAIKALAHFLLRLSLAPSLLQLLIISLPSLAGYEPTVDQILHDCVGNGSIPDPQKNNDLIGF